MKNYLILILIISLAACDPVDTEEPWEPQPTEYSPVLMKRSELEQSVKWQSARPLQNTGKIYIKDQYLFINERYRGIHVYDNSDPENPMQLGFIAIPGNIDIAMKGNVLYADSAVDLVALRVFDDSVSTMDREREAFPEFQPPDGGTYTIEERPENTVVVEWTKD